ncbi:MAG TPA: PilC/PilY family type IV pilus protein [Steroidobacteraceae bacterium]
MNPKLSLILAVAGALGALAAGPVMAAPSPFVEDFTGVTTGNNWYYFNGACLTAGTSAGTGTTGTGGALGTPGKIPACTNVFSSYYSQTHNGDAGDAKLMGGALGNGALGTTPDIAGNGALRFTNGAPYGFGENGAIVSAGTFDASQGVQITFKTVTYLGNKGGAGGDGADGMSFYLLDATQSYDVPGNGIWNGIGAFGGSLAYTCSNANNPHDGLVSGYIGLGIDEYGNFLNGETLEPGYTGATATGDNTAIGYGYLPGRIGLRGAGSISWAYLHQLNGSFYPASLSAAQQQTIVQDTCETGTLWTAASPGSASNPHNTGTPINDYAPILGAYAILPANKPIAAETATTRGAATPIVYNLQITQDGLLSFKYSYNGGAYQQVITNQSISATNGALPTSLQFGFAGSTGGSTNIHEILCFKATPVNTSASSAATDQQQTGKVQSTSQAYFSYYDPNDWTGRLTAYGLQTDSSGNVTLNTLANWDSECDLTGVTTGTCLTTGVAGPTAEAPSNRVMLTWNGTSTATGTAAGPGTAGIKFEGASLTATELTTIGDTAPNYYRLNYLRGDRSNEIPSTGPSGTKVYRARDGVLGDIVDSSPTWVGAPASPYAVTWLDRLHSTATMPENSATVGYTGFQTANQSRLNVVYVGANDGFLHAFRTGSEDASGNVINNTGTPNDGEEILAYMPGAVLNKVHNAGNGALDYSNPQYAHSFFVDATPGTGDLFYGGAWHTWLVGGLGAGGKAIYALDITNPSSTNFAEGNAASLVIGEWSKDTIVCANVTSCGTNLGNTYGTPVIRRFHNGTWGFVFGNGFGSASGDAGIYVMTINDPAAACAGATYCFRYLSTGVAGTNGIAYVTPVDLDGDHVSDYVYAGDLLGNVWRFDLTSNTASAWAVTPGALFKTPAGQPITTQLVVAAAPVASTLPSVIVAFGTGQRTQFTTTNPVTYASGAQYLYGVWDWNMSGWNTGSPAQYASMTGAQVGTATTLASPYTLGKSNLQAQTFTISTTTTGAIDTSNTAITWAQCSTTCTNGSFGWYANLPNTNGATNSSGASLLEQIVSNPTLFESALIVNSTIPANNSILSCTQSVDTGITYVISVTTGGTFTSTPAGTSGGSLSSAFVNYHDANMAGLQTNETGSLSVVTTQGGSTNLLGQLITPPPLGSGPPGAAQQIKLPPNTQANRMTWVELR